MTGYEKGKEEAMSKADDWLQKRTCYECGGMVTHQDAETYGDLRAQEAYERGKAEARAELEREWAATDAEEWLFSRMASTTMSFAVRSVVVSALARAAKQAHDKLLAQWRDEYVEEWVASELERRDNSTLTIPESVAVTLRKSMQIVTEIIREAIARAKAQGWAEAIKDQAVFDKAAEEAQGAKGK